MENQVTVIMQSQKDPAVWACHRTVETDCPCSKHQLVIHSAKLYYMCHGARVDRNNTCFWQSLPGRRIILNGKKTRKTSGNIYIYIYIYIHIFLSLGGRFEFLENKNITKDLAITFPSQSLGCSRCARARRLNPVPKRQVSWPMGL